MSNGERPKYDPMELKEFNLTEEQAEGIRHAMLQIDSGETVSGDKFFAQVTQELKALAEIRRVG